MSWCSHVLIVIGGLQIYVDDDDEEDDDFDELINLKVFFQLILITAVLSTSRSFQT